ncbi:hypothetical protein, partial [Corynebacterium sp. S5S1]|uniref:hypothetical protein n=1 Tax=Corynebacterium sp. S5S1 TaxID=1881620 RepID=UPI00257D1A18
MTITTKKLAIMFRYVAKNKNRPKSEDITNKTSMYSALGKVIFSVARLPSVMKSDVFLRIHQVLPSLTKCLTRFLGYRLCLL